MKGVSLEKNIASFNQDVEKFKSYAYTTTNRFSSIVANSRISKIITDLVNIEGKDVIDIGCGDGTYSLELFHMGKPRSIFGFDPSRMAIKLAKTKITDLGRINFGIRNIYTYLPRKKYDVAIVRGVLHHLYKPEVAIGQIAKYARLVIVVEPNGYNPVLKIIENVSRYHREHEEKSYPPFLLDYWIKKHDGSIITRKYAGIVPFFCPTWLVVLLKLVEPIVEHIPLVNMLACGSYYTAYNINSSCYGSSR